ncbi:MAG: hypothetical protein HY652_10660 [Acidobacteria bacterium]|nr:hypothetical protein [Acidobacteriota bacterium]
MKPSFRVLAVTAALAILAALCGLTTYSSQVSKQEYPGPRYPKISKVTSVEQLLPSARYIIAREKGMNVRPGYAIKGGEKVLYVSSPSESPIVREAFLKAFAEKGAKVDVFFRQSGGGGGGEGGYSGATAVELQKRRLKPFKTTGEPPWIFRMAREGGYDVVLGPTYMDDGILNYYGIRQDMDSSELLASEENTYPEELLKVIEMALWGQLRVSWKVRITDPEGTDLKFTWFPDYWQVVEGSHPTIKLPGAFSYVYKPGQSEIPLVPHHVMGVPYMIVLDKSDGEGIVGATISHKGAFPHLKITVKNHQIVKMEGGGEYGDAWRELLALRKDIQYPFLPGPGGGYWMESSIGTNPKAIRPPYVYVGNQFFDSNDRKRSGVMHLGFGTTGPLDAWATRRGLLAGHDHTHMYFPTYTVETKEGKVIHVVEKGRLTALDAPEVRQAAAKHGNPEELLKEDFIPAIPGINAPGDYWKDYAMDPISWIGKENRRAYSYLFSN